MRCFGAVAGVMGVMIACAPLEVSRAQTSASHTVTITFAPANRVVFAPAPMVLTARTAGVTSGSGSCRFSSTEAGQKIVVDLDRAMPAGATLAVRMVAPRGASEGGVTAVPTVSMDVITAIQPTSSAEALPIAYTVRSTRAMSAAGAQRMLTYTVIASS